MIIVLASNHKYHFEKLKRAFETLKREFPNAIAVVECTWFSLIFHSDHFRDMSMALRYWKVVPAFGWFDIRLRVPKELKEVKVSEKIVLDDHPMNWYELQIARTAEKFAEKGDVIVIVGSWHAIPIAKYLNAQLIRINEL